MKLEDLSSTEVELIKLMRAEDAVRLAAKAFQQRALQVAHQFSVWSEESRYGLTFSTFVNQFDYQEPDGDKMYRAVERILQAAMPD